MSVKGESGVLVSSFVCDRSGLNFRRSRISLSRAASADKPPSADSGLLSLHPALLLPPAPLRPFRLLLQAKRCDFVGAEAVEGFGFVFDAEDDAVEVAAGDDEGVGGVGGGNLGGDDALFGVAQGAIGGVGGFAAVGGVVGFVVAEGAQGVVALDIFEDLLGIDAGGGVNVLVHDISFVVFKYTVVTQIEYYEERLLKSSVRHEVFGESEWRGVAGCDADKNPLWGCPPHDQGPIHKGRMTGSTRYSGKSASSVLSISTSKRTFGSG